RRTRQSRIAHVADDADDLPERLLVVLGPHPLADDQPIGQRIAVRPESPRHLLVDDYDAWRTGRVALREIATANDRNAQDVEVAGRHERPPRETVEREVA